MNFFIFVTGVMLAIYGVTKVDGRVITEYDTNGDENDNYLTPEDTEPWLSMAKRDLVYTEDDYLLKQIMPILDRNTKTNLIRILTSLPKKERDNIAILLSGLAMDTTKSCSRLKQSMDLSQRIALKMIYPMAKFIKTEILKKLSKSDQQVVASAEQKITTSTQLLCN